MAHVLVSHQWPLRTEKYEKDDHHDAVRQRIENIPSTVRWSRVGYAAKKREREGVLCSDSLS